MVSVLVTAVKVVWLVVGLLVGVLIIAAIAAEVFTRK